MRQYDLASFAYWLKTGMQFYIPRQFAKGVVTSVCEMAKLPADCVFDHPVERHFNHYLDQITDQLAPLHAVFACLSQDKDVSPQALKTAFYQKYTDNDATVLPFGMDHFPGFAVSNGSSQSYNKAFIKHLEHHPQLKALGFSEKNVVDDHLLDRVTSLYLQCTGLRDILLWCQQQYKLIEQASETDRNSLIESMIFLLADQGLCAKKYKRKVTKKSKPLVRDIVNKSIYNYYDMQSGTNASISSSERQQLNVNRQKEVWRFLCVRHGLDPNETTESQAQKTISDYDFYLAAAQYDIECRNLQDLIFELDYCVNVAGYDFVSDSLAELKQLHGRVSVYRKLRTEYLFEKQRLYQQRVIGLCEKIDGYLSTKGRNKTKKEFLDQLKEKINRKFDEHETIFDRISSIKRICDGDDCSILKAQRGHQFKDLMLYCDSYLSQVDCGFYNEQDYQFAHSRRQYEDVRKKSGIHKAISAVLQKLNKQCVDVGEVSDVVLRTVEDSREMIILNAENITKYQNKTLVDSGISIDDEVSIATIALQSCYLYTRGMLLDLTRSPIRNRIEIAGREDELTVALSSDTFSHVSDEPVVIDLKHISNQQVTFNMRGLSSHDVDKFKLTNIGGDIQINVMAIDEQVVRKLCDEYGADRVRITGGLAVKGEQRQPVSYTHLVAEKIDAKYFCCDKLVLSASMQQGPTQGSSLRNADIKKFLLQGYHAKSQVHLHDTRCEELVVSPGECRLSMSGSNHVNNLILDATSLTLDASDEAARFHVSSLTLRGYSAVQLANTEARMVPALHIHDRLIVEGVTFTSADQVATLIRRFRAFNPSLKVCFSQCAFDDVCFTDSHLRYLSNVSLISSKSSSIQLKGGKPCGGLSQLQRFDICGGDISLQASNINFDQCSIDGSTGNPVNFIGGHALSLSNNARLGVKLAGLASLLDVTIKDGSTLDAKLLDGGSVGDIHAKHGATCLLRPHDKASVDRVTAEAGSTCKIDLQGKSSASDITGCKGSDVTIQACVASSLYRPHIQPGCRGSVFMNSIGFVSDPVIDSAQFDVSIMGSILSAPRFKRCGKLLLDSNRLLSTDDSLAEFGDIDDLTITGMPYWLDLFEDESSKKIKSSVILSKKSHREICSETMSGFHSMDSLLELAKRQNSDPDKSYKIYVKPGELSDALSGSTLDEQTLIDIIRSGGGIELAPIRKMKVFDRDVEGRTPINYVRDYLRHTQVYVQQMTTELAGLYPPIVDPSKPAHAVFLQLYIKAKRYFSSANAHSFLQTLHDSEIAFLISLAKGGDHEGMYPSFAKLWDRLSPMSGKDDVAHHLGQLVYMAAQQKALSASVGVQTAAVVDTEVTHQLRPMSEQDQVAELVLAAYTSAVPQSENLAAKANHLLQMMSDFLAYRYRSNPASDLARRFKKVVGSLPSNEVGMRQAFWCVQLTYQQCAILGYRDPLVAQQLKQLKSLIDSGMKSEIDEIFSDIQRKLSHFTSGLTRDGLIASPTALKHAYQTGMQWLENIQNRIEPDTGNFSDVVHSVSNAPVLTASDDISEMQLAQMQCSKHLLPALLSLFEYTPKTGGFKGKKGRNKQIDLFACLFDAVGVDDDTQQAIVDARHNPNRLSDLLRSALQAKLAETANSATPLSMLDSVYRQLLDDNSGLGALYSRYHGKDWNVQSSGSAFSALIAKAIPGLELARGELSHFEHLSRLKRGQQEPYRLAALTQQIYASACLSSTIPAALLPDVLQQLQSRQPEPDKRLTMLSPALAQCYKSQVALLIDKCQQIDEHAPTQAVASKPNVDDAPDLGQGLQRIYKRALNQLHSYQPKHMNAAGKHKKQLMNRLATVFRDLQRNQPLNAVALFGQVVSTIVDDTLSVKERWDRLSLLDKKELGGRLVLLLYGKNKRGECSPDLSPLRRLCQGGTRRDVGAKATLQMIADGVAQAQKRVQYDLGQVSERLNKTVEPVLRRLVEYPVPMLKQACRGVISPEGHKPAVPTEVREFWQMVAAYGGKQKFVTDFLAAYEACKTGPAEGMFQKPRGSLLKHMQDGGNDTELACEVLKSKQLGGRRTAVVLDEMSKSAACRPVVADDESPARTMLAAC